MVFVSHLIEELVAVNRELINYSMNDRLNLHKSIYASTDLLVQDFLHNTDEFEYTNFASISLIKECANDTEALERNAFSEIVQDADELLSWKESGLVDIDCCI